MPDPPAFRHRPHLDGLRALAVYLVVAFHAGLGPLAGGFVGVDLFFVLSGYLVTEVLRRDLVGAGRVRFIRFYARRVRRLLPAAITTLVVTAAAFAAATGPAQAHAAEGGLRAAALYYSNWYFIAQSTDYFAADVAGNPALHFWSLSVEEQFYAVWPVVLAGAWALSRRVGRGGHTLTVLVAAGALASGSWALWLRARDPAIAYFGTHTRVYQLLLGALLAVGSGWVSSLLARRWPRRLAPVAGVVGTASVLALATSLVDLDPVVRGMLAAAATMVVLVTLDHGPTTRLSSLLSARPVTYLGRVSYGTYLWHWPVIVLVRALGHDLRPSAMAALAAVVATTLAAASAAFLEAPIRRSAALDRRPWAVVSVGLATSAVVALVVIPGLLTPGRAVPVAVGCLLAGVGVAAVVAVDHLRRRERGRHPARARFGLAALTCSVAVGGLAVIAEARVPEPSAESVDWRAAQDDVVRAPTCTDLDRSGCVVVDGVGATVMLMGDSHAAMLIPMVAAAAEDLGLRLVVTARPACPWFVDATAVYRGDRCLAAQVDWFGPLLESYDPDIVILAQRRFDLAEAPAILSRPEGGRVETGEPGFGEFLAERTAATLDVLERAGRQIVILEGSPQPARGTDPIMCVASASDVDRCAFTAAPPGIQTEVYREAAERPRVASLAVDSLLCPALPRCDAVVDGIVRMRDPTHLTGTYSASLGPAFAQLLVDEGIVPSP